MTTKIKLRRDTAANWASTNPVLALGEPGYDTTNNQIRVGNGTSAWASLASISADSNNTIASDWQDGINDNVWRIVTVGGTKEFDFVTEGYKEYIHTITGGSFTGSNVTIDANTVPGFSDVVTNVGYENSIELWIGEDYATQLTSLSVAQAGNAVTFSFDTITDVPEGTKIVVKYWSEGTTYLDSDYDNYDGNWPLEDFLNTNSVTISTGEQPNAPWADLLVPANSTRHSIVLKEYDSQIVRKITDVVDEGEGFYTITFDGAPIDIKTLELTTTANAVVTNSQTDGNSMYISSSTYPDFGAQCHRSWWSTNSNSITGGTARSGYVVIDGGEPINFGFSGSRSNITSDWNLELASNTTWTTDSNITVHWYRDYGNIEIHFFNEQNAGNWNNGYRWLDWGVDIPEYSPLPGNGIHGGTGKVLTKVYVAEDNEVDSLSTSFGWTALGNDQQDPYDPYQQEYIRNLYFGNHEVFDNFNNEGITFNSSYKTNGDFSARLKVRIMYKFELMIGEDGYWWFDC